MLEGMYAAAAGMYAQQARLDAISNDIANVNTAGYRPMRMAFRDLLYNEGGIATRGTQLGTGAEVTSLGRASGQGGLRQTDNPLDIALSGPGFFQVRTAAGERILTRNGNLQLDAQGRISTATGRLLEPQIRVPANTPQEDIKIDATGRVRVGTEEVGRIQILDVVAPSHLRPIGDDGFAVTAESGPARPAATTTVVQNALEGSGANVADSMTAMIESQRAYELASRAITTQDKIAEIAIGVKR